MLKMNAEMEKRKKQVDDAARSFLDMLLEGHIEDFGYEEIIRKIIAFAKEQLEKENLRVCYPCIFEEYGIKRFCTTVECGCKGCKCQSKFMEEERELSKIADILECNGFKVSADACGKLYISGDGLPSCTLQPGQENDSIGRRDPYRQKVLEEILAEMGADRYAIPKVHGLHTKAIDLDEGAVKMLARYYAGTSMTTEGT